MEFLNPGALYGLVALPLLLIPYLIRQKPRRILFSSLLLFTEPSTRSGGRPLSRLRLPPIFFLQLLLLILLILALGEPVYSVRTSNIAIVLDNSASMQTLEGQRTRFALAQEKARGLLADLGPTASVDLYLTVPGLEKVRGSTFTPIEAARTLAALTPYDLADAPIDYQGRLSQLVKERKYDRLYLITDHPATGQTDTLRVITVGQPRDNFAVSAFGISHGSLVGGRLEATAEVANYSTKDERIKIALRAGGAVISSRELFIAAGKTAQATFAGFSSYPYYEVEIDTPDALPLDNRRFAVPPEAQNLRILGISPRPQAFSTLRSIAAIRLDVIAPQEYNKIDRSGYGLEIFHYAAPPVLPENPALFIMPPDNNPLVDLERPVSRPVVSSWSEPHPLTRYVNFALFRPALSRPLRPRVAGQIILESPAGPLAFATEHAGIQQLALGFDILPYLGRENLPVSVFTLNLLDWFFHGSGVEGKTTGTPLTFSYKQPGNVLLTPSGDRIALKPGSNVFAATYWQGLYQVDRGAERELVAVNLKSTTESNLRQPTPIQLRETSSDGSGVSAAFSIWPYLLLVSLILLCLEWFIRPRPLRTRSV